MIIRAKARRGQGKYAFRWQARSIMIRWPLHANEKLIDKYLFEKYNVPLKAMCLYLYKHSHTVQCDDYLITYFDSKECDKIAALITYGNLQFKGCKILREAFGEFIKKGD